MAQPGDEERVTHSESLKRLGGFSDGVFAVAITILVLSLAVPVIPKALVKVRLGKALTDMLPHFQGYVLSFLIIGLFWLAHQFIFKQLVKYDRWLFWLNLLFLMIVVFVPYATELMNKYGSYWLPVVIYAVTMTSAGVVIAALFAYATRGNRLVPDDFDHRISRHVISEYLTVSLFFLLSIPVSMWSPGWGMRFWLLIIPGSFITGSIWPDPEQRVKKAIKRITPSRH